VDAEVEGDRARCRVNGIVGWGVETGLEREVSDLVADRGDCERADVKVIELVTPAGVCTFALRRRPLWAALRGAAQRLRGGLEGLIGTHSFLTFFLVAFLLARGVEQALGLAFRWEAFQRLVFEWFWVSALTILVIQIAVVVWLVGTKLPAMADNSYKHRSRADNLGSLRRVASDR
jgi:hypothetical protein